MRVGIDVGVDAQRDGRAAPQAAGHCGDALELGFRFDVDAENPVRERGLDLGRALADAREQHARGSAAGGEHALELAARDDVEARAQARQQCKHREVRIRLDRIGDQRIAAAQGVGESAVGRRDGGA